MNALNELLSLYEKLPPDQQKQVDADTDAIIGEKRWIPQEGPQTAAYFSEAKELLYGGQGGGGKSDWLIGWALNEAKNSVIFRNGYDNVTELSRRAIAIRGDKKGFNGQSLHFDLGDGRSVDFASLEQPGSEQDWQGRRRDFMGFDEASQQTRSRIQFVLGWATGRVVYATNPPVSDTGNWLVTWFAPWLDPAYPNRAKHGELRWFVNDLEGDPIWVDGPGVYDPGDGSKSIAKTRTFIPASLKDNRYYRDTDYQASLDALPEPYRSAVRDGNFMAARQDHAFQVIPTGWVTAAQARWTEQGRSQPMTALGVDVAQGGPDNTVLAPRHGSWFDYPKVWPGKETPDGPTVAGLVFTTMRNGCEVILDMGGGYGGSTRDHLKQAFSPTLFNGAEGADALRDRSGALKFLNKRAAAAWCLREALDPDHGTFLALPPDPELKVDLCASRYKVGQGGKIQIESKEDIRARLGRSPDRGDAVIMAHFARGKANHRMIGIPNLQASVITSARKPKWR